MKSNMNNHDYFVEPYVTSEQPEMLEERSRSWGPIQRIHSTFSHLRGVKVGSLCETSHQWVFRDDKREGLCANAFGSGVKCRVGVK